MNENCSNLCSKGEQKGRRSKDGFSLSSKYVLQFPISSPVTFSEGSGGILTLYTYKTPNRIYAFVGGFMHCLQEQLNEGAYTVTAYSCTQQHHTPKSLVLSCMWHLPPIASATIPVEGDLTPIRVKHLNSVRDLTESPLRPTRKRPEPKSQSEIIIQ